MIGKSKSSAPSKSPRPAARPADLKETHNLMRAMTGTESKAIKEDLRAAREDRMSKPSAPSKSPRPMSRPASAMGGKPKSSAPSKSPRPMRSPVKKAGGGMVGYKDGGCVMAGRGGSYKGQK